MANLMTELGTEIGTKLKNQNNRLTDVENDLLTPVPAGAVFTDTVYDDSAVVADLDTKVTFFSQSAVPSAAVNGDVWQDTDTGVVARAIEENGIISWVEM